MIYNRINITPSSLPIMTILNDVRNVNINGLDISPDYQRGFIWDSNYKDNLILSLILNYPIGNIVINQLDKVNSKNAKSELVDGKQRLTTILDFVDNNYEIRSNIASDIKQTISNIMNNDETEEMQKFLKKKRFKFKDLPQPIQTNIISYSLPVYTMTSADIFQIREYFKVLQNQDKLRAGEIINSLPDNILSKYFFDVGYKFLEKLNYESLKRAEFEKIYYSIIGVLLNKIALNVNDKAIIKFVEKLKKLSEEDEKRIKKFNRNLKYILDINEQNLNGRMSKRTLKMLLSIGIYFEDFYKENALEKVSYICELSSKLAAFNSSESDDVSFSKYFGDEFDTDKVNFKDKIAPEYREIYNAFSKTTTNKNLEIAMKKLFEQYTKFESK